MRIAYFDCFSGISGDMCLGALIDAGVSLQEIEDSLRRIKLKGYRLSARRVKRSYFRATRCSVKTDTPEQGKAGIQWQSIEKMIKRSSLPDPVKQRGLDIFRRLFTAESRVHGQSFKKAHLHEAGGIDSIVDIFGTVLGLSILGIEKIYTSPINLGSGFVETVHGRLPVPCPAVAEILKGIPVYSQESGFELTTPTGAAIIRELSSGTCTLPPMTVEKIGMGAGSKNPETMPNILRVFVGQGSGGMRGADDESITIIETHIDDMNPQIYEYVTERLFKAGALDVFLTHVIMKKGRPGVQITVLCVKEKRNDLMDILLQETSTIGLRFHETSRRVLPRESKTLNTEFGKVRVKRSRLDKHTLKQSPEYEDCKNIARKLNIPLIEVMKKIRG